jgi:hypothetical protein
MLTVKPSNNTAQVLDEHGNVVLEIKVVERDDHSLDITLERIEERNMHIHLSDYP